MNDPAIIAAGRPSISSNPSFSSTKSVSAKSSSSSPRNDKPQGTERFEDQVRGMIQSHHTNGNMSKDVSQGKPLDKHPVTSASAHSDVDSIANSPHHQAGGLQLGVEARAGRAGRALDASAKTSNGAQQKPSAANKPSRGVEPISSSTKANKSSSIGTEQGVSPASALSQSNGQHATSSHTASGSSGRAKRPNQQERRQKGTLSLQDLQRFSTDAKPRQTMDTHESPNRPLPPHLRQAAAPHQTQNTFPAPSQPLPPHLRLLATRQAVPPNLAPHQQQPQHEQYRQPQHPHPPYHHNAPPVNYRANYIAQSHSGSFGPPPQQSMPFVDAQWRNNAGPHFQPQPLNRPIPQHRHLYDPLSDRRPNVAQNGQWLSPSALSVQSDFLNELALKEVQKAQITAAELEEKEGLRLRLQQACQAAIVAHELTRNTTFDGNTITLPCYGSVGSGFAMPGSDMDLALLSPASTPEPASPESEIPRLLEKTFLEMGFGARLLTKTRIPIIRFCEKPTSELAKALLQARLRWEKEKDEPPKPKKSEKDRKEQSDKPDDTTVASETKPMDSDQDREEKSDRANGTGAASETTQDILNENEIADTLSTNDAGEQVGPPRVRPDMIDDAVGMINGLKLAEHPKDTRSATKDLNPAEGNREKVNKCSSKKPIEPKTDSELVRLYGLAMSEGWFDTAEKAIIIKFISAVKSHNPEGDHSNLTHAREQVQSLPDVLSRYREPFTSPLDLPKTGVGIQCDINFSNHLALHNTHLLKCYTLCDTRVKPMVIFIKAWAKHRKINSPYHGTLSSYGYVLMVLHYLMNVVKPSVIPNLQLVPQAMEDRSPENDQVIDGYTVRFWRKEADIIRTVETGRLLQNRTDTVGSLLRGFFQYFAQPSYGGFNWGTDVLSLRTFGGLLRKDAKGWTGAKTTTTEPTTPGEDAKEIRHRYLFAIEDPFETEHNIARTVVHNGIVAIRNEFRRAHGIIQSQNGKPLADGDLLAEVEDREHLQYRYFGPLIPNYGKEKVAGAKKQEGSSKASSGAADGVATSKDPIVKPLHKEHDADIKKEQRREDAK